MKNSNTDSTANLSRFARDKRQRTTTAERVERSPRPRREADNDGFKERRPRTSTDRRASFNPHFTSDNRLRPEYEQANARLWRQGQKQTVVIHHLVTKGTMDEQVMKALHDKAADQNALLAAVKARIDQSVGK